MNLRDIHENALKTLFESLSIKNVLAVNGTINHIIDRVFERKVDFNTLLKAYGEIINGNAFCENIYESAICGGEKSYKLRIRGIKIYYSVYVNTETRFIKVRFRTVI